MQRWSEEDSAEHSYNLNRWRESILLAKIQQAKLRKQLMDQEKGLDWRRGGESETTQAASGRLGAGGGGGGGGQGKVTREVKDLKKMLAGVAEETSSALEGIASEVKGIKASDRRREQQLKHRQVVPGPPC